MAIIRWGLLSTANINRRVIPAIRASKRGELAAVASRSKASAEAYASQWDIPIAFGSYEEMIQSEAVDAIYISLPNHLHAEWTIKALEAGVHVLCEKPFALSLDDVDRMVDKARETGFVLAEAFMYRYHPQAKIVGEWVRAGRLGEITQISGDFSYAIGGRENVRLVPGWGGGSLWDVGVYPLSYAQYLMGGAPLWVVGSQYLGDTGVDMSFAGHLHYGEGRVGHIVSSFRTPFRTSLEITGTEGRLSMDRPFVHQEEGGLLFHPAGGEPEQIPVPEEYLYLGEVEDLEAAILDGEQNYLSLTETRDHVRTVLALYASAEKGEVVRLDEIG